MSAGRGPLPGRQLTADLQERRIRVLEDFADAYNRHDTAAIMSLMSDDCEFLSFFGLDPWGERFTGREAVTARVERGLRSTPDARWTDCTHTVAGDRGFSEWTFVSSTGDGSVVRRRGIDVFAFDGVLIASKSTFQKWVTTEEGRLS